MNPSPAPMMPVRSPTPRRRRWWRGVLFAFALMLVAVIALLSFSYISMRMDWEAAEAEAAQGDPRWRLMEIEADRPVIADAENSALHIIAVRAGNGVSVRNAPNYDKIFAKLPPTTQLNHQQIQLIRGELAKIAKPLQEARRLKDMPRGRFPMTYSDDFLSSVHPNYSDVRAVADWLTHDALLLAQDEQCDQAVESCQATLNAGGSLAGGVLLLPLLIRLALYDMSVCTLERVLAQGEASGERLRAMQALLDKESQAIGFLTGIRGERAGMHHLFENIRNGNVPMAKFVKPAGGWKGKGNIEDAITGWYLEYYPDALLKYYPDYLRSMNRGIAIAKLPIHEQDVKMQEWENSVKETRNPLIRELSFLASIIKFHKAERRFQAILRAAIVGLACERYRREREEWPGSLDVLVKEKHLTALPIDPIDNQRMRYRRHADGIVIYSIGFDQTDNRGNIDQDDRDTVGVDIGFRVWNVDRRRQAPLPSVTVGEW